MKDNRCNGEPVALSGRPHLIVTTTPTANGGSTARSVTFTEGLQGRGLGERRPYRPAEVSLALVNYLPPGTGTFANVVSTLLLPEGNAPTMLLVMVFRGTIASDGTVLDEVVRSYLLCHPPAGTARPH